MFVSLQEQKCTVTGIKSSISQFEVHLITKLASCFENANSSTYSWIVRKDQVHVWPIQSSDSIQTLYQML